MYYITHTKYLTQPVCEVLPGAGLGTIMKEGRVAQGLSKPMFPSPVSTAHGKPQQREN